MNIVIMRGLPGAGKSTWVEKLSGEKIICSADHFHMVDGLYKYNPTNVKKAHSECLRKYLAYLYDFSNATLIVDNTNTTAADLAPYVRLAELFDIPFKIVYLLCTPALAISRNIHGVPASTIMKMADNLLDENIPIDWNQEIVSSDWDILLSQIQSKGWRKQVKDFKAKQPNMPIPEVVTKEYTPTLEWSAGLRLSRDYLDFEVYEICGIQWSQVPEEEFLNWMRNNTVCKILCLWQSSP